MELHLPVLPNLPAALTKGKEDIYVGWWYQNKVYKPGSIPPGDVAAYVAAYARPGRMDAAFDDCRNILVDMEFNKTHFTQELPMRLLAVGQGYLLVYGHPNGDDTRCTLAGKG